MKQSSSQEIRQYITLLEGDMVQEDKIQEVAPVLGQKLARTWAGIKSKFSARAAGQKMMYDALVPWMRGFASYMGRNNENWDTTTLKTLANFMTRGSTLKLPMGELTPQPLSITELNDIMTNPKNRALMQKQLGQLGNVDNMIPKTGLSGASMKLDIAGKVAPENKSAAAQKAITALFTVALQFLFDKAEQEAQGVSQPAPQPSTKAPAPAPSAAAPAAASTPASPIPPPSPTEGSISKGSDGRDYEYRGGKWYPVGSGLMKLPESQLVDIRTPILESMKPLLQPKKSK